MLQARSVASGPAVAPRQVAEPGQLIMREPARAQMLGWPADLSERPQARDQLRHRGVGREPARTLPSSAASFAGSAALAAADPAGPSAALTVWASTSAQHIGRQQRAELQLRQVGWQHPDQRADARPAGHGEQIGRHAALRSGRGRSRLRRPPAVPPRSSSPAQTSRPACRLRRRHGARSSAGSPDTTAADGGARWRAASRRGPRGRAAPAARLAGGAVPRQKPRRAVPQRAADQPVPCRCAIRPGRSGRPRTPQRRSPAARRRRKAGPPATSRAAAATATTLAAPVSLAGRASLLCLAPLRGQPSQR